METTKDVGFADKFRNAVTLAESIKTLKVRTVEDYRSAEEKLKTIRSLEKDLEAEYKAHPVIVEATRLRTIKGDLAELLENARKLLKNGPMLEFERAEEAKRRAEEQRLAAEAKKKAESEAAALIEAQRQEYLKAERARKAAEKKGDEEAAQAARDKAEAARLEAEQIKQAAASAPEVVVVIEKTEPTITRRSIPKFRIINPALVPEQYKSIDLVKIGGVIRSLKAAANIPGVEYYEELA